MKIKLAILENDSNYLNRMVVAFNTRYADKLEIYSFTSYDVALEALTSSKIDVLVASDYFDVDSKKLPSRCGFAYLVDSPDIDNVREQRAICKFQKADLIYKQILSIYSENTENMSKIKLSEDGSKLITFSSPCGGTGTSSVAAACAVNYAKRGKKVLYLNLEPFGSSDNFFSAEGQFDMSDIIYALKSAKANLTLKLESCVKQDATGVNFFSASKVALDMQEKPYARPTMSNPLLPHRARWIWNAKASRVIKDGCSPGCLRSATAICKLCMTAAMDFTADSLC